MNSERTNGSPALTPTWKCLKPRNAPVLKVLLSCSDEAGNLLASNSSACCFVTIRLSLAGPVFFGCNFSLLDTHGVRGGRPRILLALQKKHGQTVFPRVQGTPSVLRRQDTTSKPEGKEALVWNQKPDPIIQDSTIISDVTETVFTLHPQYLLLFGQIVLSL